VNKRVSRRGFVKTLGATVALSTSRIEVQPSLIPVSDLPQTGSAGDMNPADSIAFPRQHTGRYLDRISCPLGGIATGGIGLGGRGNLRDWQIFNRPDRGYSPDYAFPALWVRSGNSEPYAVVLERRLLPPYDLTPEGLGAANAPGLPRLKEAKFFGSFPISRIEFEDDASPVKIALEAFSPFVPLDPDASGVPCTVLTYTVRNPHATSCEVAVAWSITNPVGQASTRINTPRKTALLHGLFMTNPALAPDDPLQGSFAVAALPGDGGSTEVLPAWQGGSNWHVGPQHFWFDEFSRSGHLGEAPEVTSPVGSVSIRRIIPPNGSATFRFLLAWYFPNRTPARCGWNSVKGSEHTLIGNYYCTRFSDAWAAAQHVAETLPSTEPLTRTFVRALAESSVPDVIKEAASANLSTLVTNTSFRIADGSFQGFEGCGDTNGMGFGSCTHVWNYEVATQFVFPSLARSMRNTSFTWALSEDGHMDFRHYLPYTHERWGAAAADGQMGQIVKLYFDWILSGDDDWLRGHWPAAKRALAYAWRPGGWDERRSGVMDGVQSCTYDIELFGPNPMCGSWYLAALRATAAMAGAMGEPEYAAQCTSMADAGSAWINANLFNGEYFIQKIRPIPADKIASGLRLGIGATNTLDPEFQIGDGCQVDQLIGQYMASIAGLGDLLDVEKIRSTLRSIYKYNYKRKLVNHASVQRVYALNDEAALVICDYTRGTRPKIPMPYYAEIMTGYEYSAAVLMLEYGMTSEGTECIANIRARYDGERANPYDETEYGRSYARAMASWAAIPILSGFRYNGRTHQLTIDPKRSSTRFQCFWSTPAAWGTVDLTPTEMKLSVLFGQLALAQLNLPQRFNLQRICAKLSGRAINTQAPSPPDKTIRFDGQIAVSAGTTLQVRFG
jgi:non-lysosomal glucosylceramidase